MKSVDVSKILENLQPAIDAVEDPALKHLVSVLLNLIETLVSENTILRQENQALKDAINRLKGEQGKPDIKPNTKKSGNISSEQERRQAETFAKESQNREGFKWALSSLEKLKEHRLPVEVLCQLERLNGKRYPHKASFMKAVEAEIGKEGMRQDGSLLIKHARYKKRNRKPKLSEISIDREQTCPVDKAQLPDDAVFKGYKENVVQDLLMKTDNVRLKREG